MQNLVNFKLQEVFLESLEHFEQDSYDGDGAQYGENSISQKRALQRNM